MMASALVREASDCSAVALALQRLAQEIGGAAFPRLLFDFVATLVPHDSGWVVRYHATCPPDVLHTKGVGEELVRFYLDADPEAVDPYLCSWRARCSGDVETLCDVLPVARTSDFYIRHFKARAGFADEIAIFLPADELSCCALFLERRTTPFRSEEVAAARAFFPAIMALHEAHLRAERRTSRDTPEALLLKAESLSPREREILLLSLDGRSTGEIAQRLLLTKGYIKNCRQRMYRKLGVASERAMITLIAPVAHRLALPA